MNAFGEDFHLERAAGHAAQAGGQPQLVVIACAAVQANDQIHIAQAGAQRIHIRQQIARAAFFGGFNNADDARVQHVLAFERLHGRHAGVHGIAVIGTAAAIQLAVLVLGRPGAQVAAPAFKFGLFVQVTVHQHGVGIGGIRAGLGAFHFKKQHGGTPGHAHNLQFQAGHLLRLHPAGGVAQHGVQQALLLPVGRKHGGFGGNGNVVLELANDVVVPLLADLFQGLSGVQSAGGHACVHGEPPKAVRRTGR
jgi:hypothetical protein